MRLRVHPSLILWLSVLAYLDGAALIPFAAAVILHELGHWAALSIMGRPPRRVTLRFSGAAMETEYLSYRQELIAAVAGPGASLTGMLLLPVWPELAVCSLMLGLFNLLPIPGLDGGRMLRCVLLSFLSPETAERISGILGLITALGLWGVCLYGSIRLELGLWPLLLSGLFLYKALEVWTVPADAPQPLRRRGSESHPRRS